jgi:hypothetical protein
VRAAPRPGSPARCSPTISTAGQLDSATSTQAIGSPRPAPSAHASSHFPRHGWWARLTGLLRAWRCVAKAVGLREFGHLNGHIVEGFGRDRRHVETVSDPWSLHHWCLRSDEILEPG